MNAKEVFELITYCRALDPRVGNRDDEAMTLAVAAWRNELPVAMTLPEGQRIAHDLHRNGHPLTPGSIGRRFDELATPPHQQGVTRQPRPIDQPRREPPARPELPPVGRVLSGPETSEAVTRHGLIGNRAKAAELAVACPHCGAGPWKPCVTGAGRPLTLRPCHPSRAQAYGDLTRQEA